MSEQNVNFNKEKILTSTKQIREMKNNNNELKNLTVGFNKGLNQAEERIKNLKAEKLI